MKFGSPEEYGRWIASQDWYQTIHLGNGLVTRGKFATDERIPILSRIGFKGKSVLDVGCNSGQYSMLAKKQGAERVLGIDLDETRLAQAKHLAANEGLDVEFRKMDFIRDDIQEKFDIILCIAVLTEIPDLVLAINRLKELAKEYIFLELGLAKPLLYVGRTAHHGSDLPQVNRKNGLMEVRMTKRGLVVLRPTFPVLQNLFGDGFSLEYGGKGLRYDMVHAHRVGGEHQASG